MGKKLKKLQRHLKKAKRHAKTVEHGLKESARRAERTRVKLVSGWEKTQQIARKASKKYPSTAELVGFQGFKKRDED